MATSASSQRISPNPPSSTPGQAVPSRWGKLNTESGSALSNMSKGGRGRPPRGRGGRGGRMNNTTRDGRVGGAGLDKPDVEKPAPISNTPSTQAIPPSDKIVASSPSTTTKPKPSSRRPSRAVPPVVVAPTSPIVDVPPTPIGSSRPQHRRRRSHTAKSLVGAVPKGASVKDTPPHLSNSLDMRNNIDALVERVRAVAMADNRPSTPGSHIDWAGDDDDSLPDLDDWGITTSVSNGIQATDPSLIEKRNNITPGRENAVNPLAPPIGTKTPQTTNKPRAADPPVALVIQPADDSSHISPSISNQPTPHNASTDPGPNKPLHHSLPPKPVIGGLPSKPKTERGAHLQRRAHQPQTPTPLQSEGQNSQEEQTIPEVAEPVLEHSTPEQGLTESIHAPDPSDSSPKADLATEPKPREGLAASIHAPISGSLSQSSSAPSHLSSYTPTHNSPRNPALTHTRAHTVGRPPSFPRSAHGDANLRPSRSGYATPRGGPPSGGYHSRTHSSPPAGVVNRTPNTSRPILTGAGISKIVKVLNNRADSVSPARSGTAVTSND
ncbi:hypothetical protein BD779DRAFT_1667331 [Infundibulicybe gibba]|nr:hypothetical protein BD779DRAFT_1667331 [Infundibulicybe gibba]